MKKGLKLAVAVLFVGCLVVVLSGCTVVFQKRHGSDVERIESLSGELERLKMTEDEYLKLKGAYDALAKSLSQEIDEDKVRLGIARKGLVITIVDSVLFDSGKTKLRKEAFSTLDKVASVCKRKVANREIGIEGHTDNQPIKHSAWKSNWELSTARATSVLHHLAKKGISGGRLSATGYGEYRPLATNKTVEGRQQNRRVEIVVLPDQTSRAKQSAPKKYTK
ncbi:MAG: OmpA family protein [Candidatus Omnitrophica bacterium]|nr:OmpA family protein [Candidatus Omnitrophota bacterium]